MKKFVMCLVFLGIAVALGVYRSYPSEEVFKFLLLRPLLMGAFAFFCFIFIRRESKKEAIRVALANVKDPTLYFRKANFIVYCMVVVIFCYLMIELFHHASIGGFSWAPLSLGGAAGSSFAQAYLYRMIAREGLNNQS